MCALYMDVDVCLQVSGICVLTYSLISKLQFLRNMKTFDGGGAYNRGRRSRQARGMCGLTAVFNNWAERITNQSILIGKIHVNFICYITF